MDYTTDYFLEMQKIIGLLQISEIEKMIDLLADMRAKQGRLFFLGIGGGAGNASHAVNDFRKIAGFEAYSPTDNASELTARINDDGWETVFVSWLKGSRIKAGDGLFIFSVGGGNLEKKISANLVYAVQYAHEVGAKVLGIVGRDGGYTAQAADACVVIPTVNPETVTPHTESFQGIIWHLIVSHPKMKVSEMKWESVK
ncbi:MAG: SIS domain-containing protein [bacterium]